MRPRLCRRRGIFPRGTGRRCIPRLGTGTTSASLGHFWREVPDSLHIRACPFLFAVRGAFAWSCKAAANGQNQKIRGRGSLVTLAIAMQKVVGSNPISRFFGNALRVGGSASTGESRITWNHPRISPTFQALIRISA